MRSKLANVQRNDARPAGPSPNRFVRVVAIAALVLAMTGTATPAYAYIDPGTGGMLLQLLLGGAAGAAVIVRLYWHRIKTGFQRLTGNHTEEADPATDQDRKTDR